MRRLVWKTAVVFTMVVAMGFIGEAKAAFSLKISSGASSVTINDNLAGDLAGATSNLIIAAQSVNGYTVSVTASTNSPGAGGVGQITQGTIAVMNNGSGGGASLIIELTSSGFTLPFAVAKLANDISSTLLAGTGSRADGTSFMGAAPTPTATLFGPLSNASTGTSAIVPTNSTISNRLVLSNLAVSTTSAVANVTLTSTASNVVPEPASVIALATALPLLGWRAIRRRRSAEIATA